MTLAEARTAAREALNALLEGKHPKRLAEEKRKAADAAARDRGRQTPSARSPKISSATICRRSSPPGSTRPVSGASLSRTRHAGRIAEIRRREIIALLKGIAERSGAEAGAGDAGGPIEVAELGRRAGPARLRGQPNRLDQGRAILSARPRPATGCSEDDELAAIWRATDSLSPPFAGVYRLLLLTGRAARGRSPRRAGRTSTPRR